MKYNKFSRRMFLEGAGGALLTIPFLNSLVPSEARAAEGVPIKRYFNMNTVFHVGHHRNWFPKLTTLANPLVIPGSPHTGSYDRLSNLVGSGQLSRILNSSLNPYLSKMMLYKGLDVPTHGFHVEALHLGDTGDSNPEVNDRYETIDRLIARNAKFDPAMRPSIRLGSWGHSVDKVTGAPGRMVYPIAGTAIDAYNILFSNGTYPEAGGAPPVHPRRDLLTRIMSDYRRVVNGRQISSVDKVTLSNALDKISDLQAGLTANAVLACRHRGQDATPANNMNPFRFDSALNYRNYVNLIQAIFLCDISRSVTFGVGLHESQDNTGLGDFHGNVSHKLGESVAGVPNWRYVGDMYGNQTTQFLGPLLQSMDSMLDAANGKSFLHNGLFHIAQESVYTHRQTCIPTATFGSLNGTLPTGYMVNYCDPTRPFTFGGGSVNGDGAFNDDPASATDPLTDNHTYDYPGIPYQRFLVTVLQAMGLAPADYENDTINKHMENRTDSLYGAQNNGISRMGGYGVASLQTPPPSANDGSYHHDGRLRRYNFNYYKAPVPLPPAV